MTDPEFDAAVVGSGLYAGRWTGRAARLVKHLARDGFTGPVWLFQSGPLGDEDAASDQPYPKKVLAPASQLDVRAMVTFGGRLIEHPEQFIAKAMAKNLSGDWRDWEDIDAWAVSISDALTMHHAA